MVPFKTDASQPYFTVGLMDNTAVQFQF